ncbi:MAG: M28 family peptidase, partial [Planctomycetota bacterium]
MNKMTTRLGFRQHRFALAGTLLLAAVFSLKTERGAVADVRGDLATARASITQAELMQAVAYLASDDLEGREAGTSGGRRAGDWIADRFTELGLTPAGTEGYFQPFGDGYRNVLAYLPGADDQVADDIIVVSAHYDHVGYGTKRNTRDGPGKIHNGADDNASGTSTVLELAEALKQLPSPPRRSYLFALWDAEEKGLLGSKHWVENATLPIERVKLNVNVDMVGRLRDAKLYVFGTRTAAGLRSLAARANRDNALELLFSWRFRRDSDHYAFCRHGTPALLFHTGLHDDYHAATDDAEKINAAGMETIGRMLFDVLIELDTADALPEYRPAAEKESDAVFKSLVEAPGRWRGRLKVRVKPDGGNGVIVVGTDPES